MSDIVKILIDDIDVNVTGSMMEISQIISYEEFIKILTEDETLSIESQDNQIIFNVKTDKKFI